MESTQAQDVTTLKDQFLAGLGELSGPRQSVAEYVAMMAAFHSTRGTDQKYNYFLKLIRDGKFYGAQPLPKKYAYGEMKQCFANSYNLAINHDDLTYCEGIAIGIIPVHHAWVINAKDRVIDVTWRTRENDGAYKHNPGEMAYLGLKFTREDLQVNLVRHHQYGGLLMPGAVYAD